MNETKSALIALFTLSLGCTTPPVDVACKSAAGITRNGRTPNGITRNGITRNGITRNGVSLNGLRVNGISLDGYLVGGALEGVSPDGRLLAGDDFVGAELELVTDDGAIPLTIAAVEPDGDDPALTWYRITFADGEDLCAGGGAGLFVDGVWDETGARHESMVLGGETVSASFSCELGAIAKCVRWGYRPWLTGADLHQSCVRMTVADYCGDGASHTEDGTRIDIFDVRGIQVSEASPGEGFVFEAGWGPDGAVCLSHARHPDLIPSCMGTLPACADWDQARAQGALLGNQSTVDQARCE